MSLSNRDIEYYVVATGNTKMNTVILQNWEMFMGSKKDACVYNYIFCSHIDNDTALFIFKNDASYYVVKSSETSKDDLEDEFERIQKEISGVVEEEEHVTVNSYDSLKQCIDEGLTKRERELLNLKKTHKIKLSADLKKDLQGIVCIDFINVKDRDYETMLQDYVNMCDDKLRLSMIPYLTMNELQNITFKETINTVILSNNELLDSLVWLSHIPKLETLYISSCVSIHNESVEGLVTSCSGLEEISFYNCQNITLESMSYLLQLKNIKSISFMNTNMKCWHKPLEPLISKEQWASFVDLPGVKSLEYLDINSVMVTKDILHDLLYCCTNIKRLSIHSDLFNKFLKDIDGSYGTGDVLTICATYDDTLSCDFTKPIIIRNLLRDQFQNPFSESMLRVIKKIKNDCSL